MTDDDALLHAICDQPDHDTPRLIFADLLDDTGEAERAAFVRAQVELARTPDWEPFAVLCRHRRPDWSAGTPFRESLPPLPAFIVWPDHPFRRGFGWRVRVRSMIGWARAIPHLFEQAPVGEVDLNPPATLEDWRRIAAGDWLRRLRVVHLSTPSPVEPIRVLCDSPHTTGITDLHFHRASSAGLPELLEDLLRTPLGRAVRGLHFRAGYESLEPLIDALTPGSITFDRLSFAVMGLSPELIRRFCDRGGLSGLTELNLWDDYTIGNMGAHHLASGFKNAPPTLHTLTLKRCGVADLGAAALAGCAGLSELRQLDLTESPLTSKGVRALAESTALAGLRSLGLKHCRVGDRTVRALTRARFWPNLVELDLRENPISDPGIGYLLRASVPPNLTALLLDGEPIGAGNRAALQQHFGEALIWSK